MTITDNDITVAYDTGYDDASRSMTAVSCSDGANGLITRYGWQTQGAVAGFPYIGAAAAVSGWNSAQVSEFLYYTLSPLRVPNGNGTLTRLLSIVRYLLAAHLQWQDHQRSRH